MSGGASLPSASSAPAQTPGDRRGAGCPPQPCRRNGVPPAEPPDPGAVSARVTELVADLVEPAKTTALERLDEGRQPLTIATAWLRPKLLPKSIETGGVGPARHIA